jgi:hypothetical protein
MPNQHSGAMRLILNDVATRKGSASDFGAKAKNANKNAVAITKKGVASKRK